VALACAALGVVVPGVARAQVTPAAVTEQARRLFHQGITLADQDRWAEALAAFQQSLGLVPRASTRFNLARALLRLGRLREAIEVFDAYLAEAQGAGEAARVAEATRLRAEAVAALSTLRLVGLPEEAEVSVDGALLPGRGAPRVLRVDPGVRRVEVRDAAGNVVEMAPVEARGLTMRGDNLSDGTPVAVCGRRGPDGIIHTYKIFNLHTRSLLTVELPRGYRL